VNFKKAFKIPGLNGGKHDMWVFAAGAIAVGALYFILSGKYTGLDPVDDILRGTGNRIGIEGVGDPYLKPIPIGEPFVPTTPAQRAAMQKQAMYVDAFQGSDDEENRITIS
jgi:hypothetical protein